MILIFREIRSRVGDEAGVLTALRTHAGVLIRTRQADAVLVCERADVPQDFLWILLHGGSPGQSSDGEDSFVSLESGRLVSHGEPVRVQFVDGIYQFPIPPCRLWRVETRNEAVGRVLLHACRLPTSDGRIGGVSFYRTITDPLRMIGFLALVPEVAPGDVLVALGAGDDAGWTCHPLRVSWSVGRLPPGGAPVSSRVHYPRASFSARMTPGLPSEAVTGVGG